ncbi:MAG: helix-turn-helix transcriptional regulator [Clostridium sp.]|nr:helix-turn-helix transcriptional regulator [Clostridium sp.]
METPEETKTLPEHFEEGENFSASRVDAEIVNTYLRGIDSRDTSFIFVYISKGNATVSLDFKDVEMKSQTATIITPGQVFNVVSVSDDAQGWLVKLPADKLSKTENCPFQYLLLDSSPIALDQTETFELTKIFDMLERRSDNSRSDTPGVVRLMCYTFAAIILEALERRTRELFPDKIGQIELIGQLYHMIDKDITKTRFPSYYAGLLGISPSYLNEKFRRIMGQNISLYIRRESILRAARRIVLTSLPFRDIALEAGYDDQAYFTRQFTKVTGLTPTQFRNKYSR